MITNAQISRYMVLSKKKKAKTIDYFETKELKELREIYEDSLNNNPKKSVNDEDLKRISELSNKNKAGCLSSEEEDEYVILRLAFVLASKRNVASQVSNIDLVNADGTIENVGEKYGKSN